MKTIAILDGSLHGKEGNTYGVIEELLPLLPKEFQIDYVELKNIDNCLTLEKRLRAADGFILATGTYWQSWGSPMQRFFEQTTDWEATDIWLGKPACTIITMHSIGGLEVMGRLQSNLNMLGAFIPPMCCIVHSHVNQMAGESDEVNYDVWDLKYLSTIANNMIAAINKTGDYKAWEVDRGETVTGLWLKK